MRQNKVPLLPFVERTAKSAQETFILDTKASSKLAINYKKVLINPKKTVAKIQSCLQSSDQVSINKRMNTDRPNKIKFIKEVQKEIRTIRERKKIMSTFKAEPYCQKSSSNKENYLGPIKVTRAWKEPPFVAKSQEICLTQPQSAEKSPNRFPPCKVGRVRYRTISKNPLSYWEKIKLSEIEIKENNEEEIVTLQRIQIELSRC